MGNKRYGMGGIVSKTFHHGQVISGFMPGSSTTGRDVTDVVRSATHLSGTSPTEEEA